jgi:hypothetical protein
MITAAAVVGADHHQACQFAVGAGKRVEREFAHATDLAEKLLESMVGFECSLHGRFRLIGVQRCHLGQCRHLFIDFGIILHRTRSKRIETAVNAEVVGAHVGVVAHDGWFVDLRQAWGVSA